MSFHDQNQNQIKEQDVSPRACRNLWVAVLTENYRVAFEPRSNDRPVEIRQARLWFGTKDFAIVCELAGLDPAWVWQGLQLHMREVGAA